LLDYRSYAAFPASLRAIIVGGGPVPKELLDRCPIAYPTYGMTETGSMLTCAKPDCNEDERFSAGSPLPRTRISIQDEAGNLCGDGQSGNIYASGPGMFNGYVNDPQKTALVLNEGWIKTGDIGYLDKSGCLHVLARRTDLIISGGENIIPAEIEAVLRQHPQILDAVVLPIADEKWGQAPGAVIVSQTVEIPEMETITLLLNERLASYKHPRRFVFTESLPLLPTGKIDLAAVRALLENQDSI
jgi:O-succinylbenzoic acid--CoA ligase